MDNMIDYLPEGVLVEILLSLPPASLCRSKSVSKEWNSMISSTYFTRTYASKSPRWTFVPAMECHQNIRRRVMKHKLLTDLNLDDVKCPSPICNQPIDHEKLYMVMGVSNGLVLYSCRMHDLTSDECSSHLNVCNLVTKQCVVLPPRITCRLSAWGFLTEMKDGVVTSYTAVILGRFQFLVFFSKTGEWKAYTVQFDRFYRHRNSSELNGILHWLHSKEGITAYDPHRNPKAIRDIAFPRPGSWVHGGMRMISTQQGHLRFLDSDAQGLSIWVLNDYGFGDNWLLQHRVDHDYIHRHLHCGINRLKLTSNLQPISFHPFDPDIVYFGCDFVFVSYNMRERKSQVVNFFSNPKMRQASYRWLWALTLVIPPFSISLPSISPLKLENETF